MDLAANLLASTRREVPSERNPFSLFIIMLEEHREPNGCVLLKAKLQTDWSTLLQRVECRTKKRKNVFLVLLFVCS